MCFLRLRITLSTEFNFFYEMCAHVRFINHTLHGSAKYHLFIYCPGYMNGNPVQQQKCWCVLISLKDTEQEFARCPSMLSANPVGAHDADFQDKIKLQ